MNKQTEITEKTSLLKPDGMVNAVGWCRRCLVDYNKENIPNSLRIRKKEWDFYQVSDGEWLIQVCFANITVGAAATCDVKNLKTGEKHSFASIIPAAFNRYVLTSQNAENPSVFEYSQGGVYLKFDVKKAYREIVFKAKKGRKNIDLYLRASHIPDNESITIVTPFSLPKRFFLTTKYNCMPTEGRIILNEKTVSFAPDKTFCVLDWGRGVWPYKNYWYWGNGAKIIDGKLFGFEITWGIGDTSSATETCVFYDGKAHKIGAVDVAVHPKKQGYMKPWVFSSDDGRFNLTMTPFYDNASGMIFMGLIGMKTHQVHGYFNGTVVLDDGKVLEIKNMYAFCEYVENRW